MHLFLKVVELDEHTCSSYEGQFSSQTQRASNESNALHTAKYSQVTFMHGSSSVEYKQLYEHQKLISLAADRIPRKAYSHNDVCKTSWFLLIRLMKWDPAQE